MPAQKMMTKEKINDGKRVIDGKIKLEVHLTDHCNLNCKGCDHFSPIADESYLDIAQYSRDLDRIGCVIGNNIERLFLLGGEPLLNKKICEIIEISRLKLKECPIFLITNGILLSKMPSNFWESCRNNDIIISITQYPIDIDYEKILAIAKKEHVEVRIFKDPSGEKKLYHLRLDLEGEQDFEKNYLHCWRPQYLILKEGRIFPCVIPAYINYFNSRFSCDIPVSDKDSIDIYKIDSFEELKKELSIPKFFCSFCNIYGEITNLPFEISNRSKEEWL